MPELGFTQGPSSQGPEGKGLGGPEQIEKPGKLEGAPPEGPIEGGWEGRSTLEQPKEGEGGQILPNNDRPDLPIPLPETSTEALLKKRELEEEILFSQALETPSKQERKVSIKTDTTPKESSTKVQEDPKVVRQDYNKTLEAKLQKLAKELGLSLAELKLAIISKDPVVPQMAKEKLYQEAQNEVQEKHALPTSWQPQADPLKQMSQTIKTTFNEVFSKMLEKTIKDNPHLTHTDMLQLTYMKGASDSKNPFFYSPYLAEINEELGHKALKETLRQLGLPTTHRKIQLDIQNIVWKETSTNKQVHEAILNGFYSEFLEERLPAFIKEKKLPSEKVELFKKALKKSSALDIPKEIKELADEFQKNVIKEFQVKHNLPTTWTPAPIGTFEQLSKLEMDVFKSVREDIQIVKDYVNQGLIVGDPGVLSSLGFQTTEEVLTLVSKATDIIGESLFATTADPSQGRLQNLSSNEKEVLTKVDLLKTELERLSASTDQTNPFINVMKPLLDAIAQLKAIATTSPASMTAEIATFLDHNTDNKTFGTAFKKIDEQIAKALPTLPESVREDFKNICKTILVLDAIALATGNPTVKIDCLVKKIGELDFANRLPPDQLSTDAAYMRAPLQQLTAILALSMGLTLVPKDAAFHTTAANLLKACAQLSPSVPDNFASLLNQLSEGKGDFDPIAAIHTMTDFALREALTKIREHLRNPEALSGDVVSHIQTMQSNILEENSAVSNWTNNLKKIMDEAQAARRSTVISKMQHHI